MVALIWWSCVLNLSKTMTLFTSVCGEKHNCEPWSGDTHEYLIAGWIDACVAADKGASICPIFKAQQKHLPSRQTTRMFWNVISNPVTSLGIERTSRKVNIDIHVLNIMFLYAALKMFHNVGPYKSLTAVWVFHRLLYVFMFVCLQDYWKSYERILIKLAGEVGDTDELRGWYRF